MERLVWLNGAFVPEAEAALPIRDLGLIYGEAVFDTARTFGGRLFMGAEHVDRLYRSLEAVRLPEPMPKAELLALTEELIARNARALRPGEDWWVTQRITAGLRPLDGEAQLEVHPGVAAALLRRLDDFAAQLGEDGAALCVVRDCLRGRVWARSPCQRGLSFAHLDAGSYTRRTHDS